MAANVHLLRTTSPILWLYKEDFIHPKIPRRPHPPQARSDLPVHSCLQHIAKEGPHHQSMPRDLVEAEKRDYSPSAESFLRGRSEPLLPDVPRCGVFQRGPAAARSRGWVGEVDEREEGSGERRDGDGNGCGLAGEGSGRGGEVLREACVASGPRQRAGDGEGERLKRGELRLKDVEQRISRMENGVEECEKQVRVLRREMTVVLKVVNEYQRELIEMRRQTLALTSGGAGRSEGGGWGS